MKRICIKECQDDYINTLAGIESDCTHSAWFKILNKQHFVNKAVKFVRAFLDYIEACYEIFGNSNVMFSRIDDAF